MQSLLDIDWTRPWLAGLRSIGEPLTKESQWREALDRHAVAQTICNANGKQVRFVPHQILPAGVAYETFISETGCVPTRENLHDFFNALVWLLYPKIKAQLNRLQATAISHSLAEEERTVRRGRLRDAITIFDENAAILVTRDPSIMDALRAHMWQELFLENSTDFHQRCEMFVFGHALMEKLVNPYKAITAHVWVVSANSLSNYDRPFQVDAAVSQEIVSGFATSDLLPLPVLGIPGWWPDQNQAFYLDTQVFRPPRIRSP